MTTQTTKLDDLPISSHTEDNIMMDIKENNVKINSVINDAVKQREEINVNSQQPKMNINEDKMKNFSKNIQKAASVGALQLQSRDIPQNQSHLTQDSQAQPSFVPDTQENDYIGNMQTQNDIIKYHDIKKSQDNKIDDIYNNIQTPLLIAVLYFVFQLPVIKLTTLKYFPSLFRKDGNLNLLGYITNSISFALIFYTMTITLEYLSL